MPEEVIPIHKTVERREHLIFRKRVISVIAEAKQVLK